MAPVLNSAIDLALKQRKAQQSPADFAEVASYGHFERPWHINVFNNALMDAFSGNTRRLIVSVPPRHGKEIADSVRVMTMQGWKRHGDLMPGDCVFHPSGMPVRVLATRGAHLEKMRITFTDNSVIDAHPNHEWTVFDRSAHKWRTIETRQMVGDFSRARYQLPLMNALQLPERNDLVVDPYTLGVWLGDGSTGAQLICGKEADLEGLLERIPYSVSRRYAHGITGVAYARLKGLARDLKAIGVRESKRIPLRYLLASEEQRRALLAGLVDTDGSVAGDGTQRVRFVNCNKHLIDDVTTLVRSLGYRVTVTQQDPYSNGRGIVGKQIAYTVQWTPHDGQGGGWLARKRVSRVRVRRAIGILSVRECEPELGQCIQVDAPDGLYLVGETLIATHNSEMISKYFPAWWLGKRPDDRVILASYESEFAATWGRKARDVAIEWDRKLFGVEVNDASNAANRWDIKGHAGGMVTTGVGAALTGKGANCLIIDDPVKNSEESRSKTVREKTWDWWTGTARTRLEPSAVCIIVMTRWNTDDLVGRILEQENERGADHWKYLRLPAIATDDEPPYRMRGDALWPERYSVEDLNAIREDVTDYWFNAQFQGTPAPEDGLTFKRDGIRYWKPYPDGYLLQQSNGEQIMVKGAKCWKFLTVDLAASAAETADFTVIACWSVTPNNDLVLLDMDRRRMQGPEKIPAMQAMLKRHGASYVAIERAGYQLDTIQNARAAGLPVVKLEPKGDKVSRAMDASIRWSAGQIYVPINASWLGAVEGELYSFPSAGGHDDIVDVFSYAALEVSKRGFSPDQAYGLVLCENPRCGRRYTCTEKTGLDRPCPYCHTRRQIDDENSFGVPNE